MTAPTLEFGRRDPLPPAAAARAARVRVYRGAMTPGDPRHGTDAGYVAGCHDACCRTAHAQLRRDRRREPSPLVDAIGTQRRIQALARLGWSSAALSRELGRHRSYLRKILEHSQVQAETATIVAHLFERLAMTRCPAVTASRTIEYASKHGWPPPLAWDNIDDPDEHPTGWTYATDRDAVLRELVDEGADLWDVLRALELSRDTFNTWCARNDHRDTFALLVHRAESRDHCAARRGTTTTSGVAA